MLGAARLGGLDIFLSSGERAPFFLSSERAREREKERKRERERWREKVKRKKRAA